MNELEILQSECYVDKRRLVLAFMYRGKKHVFTHDHWDDENIVNEYTIDGQKKRRQVKNITSFGDGEWFESRGEKADFDILETSKHRVLALLYCSEEMDYDNYVIVDRAYRHNRSFDVYFYGKHYLVGNELP